MTDDLWGVLMWAPILGALGLIAAGGFYVYILRQLSGSGAMREIAMAIHKGASVVGIVDHDTRHSPSRQGLILSRIYGTLRRIGWS